MKRLKNILQYNDFYLVVYALFLIYLTIKYIFVLPILIIYIIRFKNRIDFKILSILFIIFVFLITTKNYKKEKHIYGYGYVYDIKETDYNYLITFKYKNRDYNFYSNEYYDKKIYLKIDADIVEYDRETIPNGFNSYKYYLSKNIYGKLRINDIEETDKKHYSFYIEHIKSNIRNRLDENVKPFVNSIIFNERDSNFYDNYNSLNISYLLKLSGIHIYLLIIAIEKILFYFDINRRVQKIIVLSILVILSFFQQFNIVLMRIIVYQFLIYIKKYLDIELDNLNLINLSYIIVILFNINELFYNRIIIMFLLSNALYMLEPIYNDKNYFLRLVIQSLIANIVLLPFTNNLNIITIIFIPLISFLIMYIIYPLVWISVIFYPIGKLTKFIFIYFNDLLSYINISSNSFLFKIGYVKPVYKVIYFSLLILQLYLKNIYLKIISILTIVITLFIPNLKRIYLQPRLFFLDVGQGDSFVYIDKDLVIVVDSYQYVGNFLSSMGINKIDYLILSHSDSDHTKEAETLIENYNVENLVLSKYDEYNINFNNIIYATDTTYIKDGDVEIDFYGPIKKYKKTNDNSLVFKLKYLNNEIMFTGDIEEEAEQEISNKYKYSLSSNIIKVSHHGSDTSSSLYFLKYVEPEYAVISVGRNNRYNFPDDSVLKNINYYTKKIYRTDLDYTIIYYKNKFYKYRDKTMKTRCFIV